MSSRRKPSPARSANKAGRARAESAGHDPEVDDFVVRLRLSRNGGRLPQGCTPAEKRAALEAVAEMNGVEPISNPAEMTADFWPSEKSADEIVAAIRTLRRDRK
jgi:hypothetical protein